MASFLQPEALPDRLRGDKSVSVHLLGLTGLTANWPNGRIKTALDVEIM